METETTKTIADWGKETFGEARNPSVYVGRALLEYIELMELIVKGSDWAPRMKRVSEVLMNSAVLHEKDYAAAAQELADVFIVLEQAFAAVGTTSEAEVNKKMAINRNRSWTKLQDGVAQHNGS